jgi:hypothetical protein
MCRNPDKFPVDIGRRTPCLHSSRGFDYAARQAFDPSASGICREAMQCARHNSTGGIIPAKTRFAHSAWDAAIGTL